MSLKRIAIALAVLTLFAAVPVWASAEKPGKGITVNPGRATWTTGFFQEAIVRKGWKRWGTR